MSNFYNINSIPHSFASTFDIFPSVIITNDRVLHFFSSTTQLQNYSISSPSPAPILSNPHDSLSVAPTTSYISFAQQFAHLFKLSSTQAALSEFSTPIYSPYNTFPVILSDESNSGSIFSIQHFSF